MLKKSIFLVIFSVIINTAMSQPPNINGGGSTGPGGPTEPGTGNQPPPEGAVPVDGGLAFLLVAGASYGAKKAYDYRKNKVKSEK